MTGVTEDQKGGGRGGAAPSPGRRAAMASTNLDAFADALGCSAEADDYGPAGGGGPSQVPGPRRYPLKKHVLMQYTKEEWDGLMADQDKRDSLQSRLRVCRANAMAKAIARLQFDHMDLTHCGYLTLPAIQKIYTTGFQKSEAEAARWWATIVKSCGTVHAAEDLAKVQVSFDEYFAWFMRKQGRREVTRVIDLAEPAMHWPPLDADDAVACMAPVCCSKRSKGPRSPMSPAILLRS